MKPHTKFHPFGAKIIVTKFGGMNRTKGEQNDSDIPSILFSGGIKRNKKGGNFFLLEMAMEMSNEVTSKKNRKSLKTKELFSLLSYPPYLMSSNRFSTSLVL